MRTQNNKQNEKILYIKVEERMKNIINEFCRETDTDVHNIGFQTGNILGAAQNNQQVAEALRNLNQIFFWAGIMFAKEHSDKITYKRVLKKDMKKTEERILQELGVQDSVPNYLG
jgi:hypothetical protein